MNDDLKILENITNALNSMLKGEESSPIAVPDDYPDKEVRSHALIVNELIEKINSYTESAFSLSRGDLSSEIPRGRIRIHDALKNMQANLNHLTWTTKRIADGDFNRTVDFMGEFSKSFNSMTLQLKEAFETIDAQKNQLLDREKEMNRDLKLAGILQKNFISGKISIPGVDVHTVYKPVIQIGGDIYSFTEFRDEDQFGIFIADVNGHGIHAALLTGMLKVLINSAGEKRREPSRLLAYINSRIIELDLDIYFTAFYGICDIQSKKFIYSRGGHNLPYLITDKGIITTLDSKGPMLGVMEDIFLEEKSADLSAGDKLIIYTDGLTEAENDERSTFEDILENVLSQNTEMNIKDYVEHIYRNLIDFCGSDEFKDDVCIAGIELIKD